MGPTCTKSRLRQCPLSLNPISSPLSEQVEKAQRITEKVFELLFRTIKSFGDEVEALAVMDSGKVTDGKR